MKLCGCLGLPDQVLQSYLYHNPTASSSKAHRFSPLIARGRSFFLKKVIDGFQKLSSHCYLGDGLSSAFGRFLLKSPIRRLAHRMVGCFHQGPSKPLRSLHCDMSCVRGIARDMNTRDQPGIRAKMFGTGETSNLADLTDNQKSSPLSNPIELKQSRRPLTLLNRDLVFLPLADNFLPLSWSDGNWTFWRKGYELRPILNRTDC
jgi:hypothetical protein